MSAHLLSQICTKPNLGLLKRRLYNRKISSWGPTSLFLRSDPHFLPDVIDVVLEELANLTDNDFCFEDSSHEQITSHLKSGEPVICILENSSVGSILQLTKFGLSSQITEGNKQIGFVITSYLEGDFFGYVARRDLLVNMSEDLLKNASVRIIRTYLRRDVVEVSSSESSESETEVQLPTILLWAMRNTALFLSRLEHLLF
jgi:hypothetical protein